MRSSRNSTQLPRTPLLHLAFQTSLFMVAQPSWFAIIFRPAALALADLMARGQLRLSLEVGDAHAAIERVCQTTPSLAFDRVYLSNVPDYTSMLNVFLYFTPVLRKSGSTGGGGEPPAVFEHELLLNTLLWSSLEQYTFSSTCLRPSDYWMLGVRLVSGDHMDQDGKPRWGTSDGGECKQRFIDAGRPTVESWLHRLLLACVLPPPRDARYSQKSGRGAPARAAAERRAARRRGG